MGILDDAIREHLELKRTSGADPGDVARLEREAFGAPQPAEAGSEAASPAPAVEVPAPAVEVPAPVPDVAPVEPEAAVPAADPEPEAPAAPEPEAPAPDEDDQATRQFTAIEADEAQRSPPAAAKSEPQEDDVHDELEETPDFLQETPDHDRLWFEQKPPRDFDF